MKILYLTTSPEPAVAGTDAVFQEIEALRGKGGGDYLNLFPLARPSRFVPKFLYGIRALDQVAELNQKYDLFHVYNSQLQVFPFLKKLKKPIIYSVVAGLGSQTRPPSKSDMQHIEKVVLSNERDAAIMDSWGFSNYRIIRSGIDTTHFKQSLPSSPSPVDRASCPTPQSKFTLLVGSAPWTKGQFATKGIDALIAVASKMADLRLVFLWRGGHLKLLQDKIAKAGIGEQIEIINERTDVGKLLQRVHATTVLAKTSKLVKAYPHSLMESLAACRPVLISRTIPMSDYVEQNRCGEIIETLELSDLQAAIDALRTNYSDISIRITANNSNDFSQQRLIEEYENMYNKSCNLLALVA